MLPYAAQCGDTHGGRNYRGRRWNVVFFPVKVKLNYLILTRNKMQSIENVCNLEMHIMTIRYTKNIAEQLSFLGFFNSEINS